MSDKDFNDSLKDEIEAAAYDGIADVVEQLTRHYLPAWPEGEDFKQSFLNVFVNLLADVLAHYPDEKRDEAYQLVINGIEQMMVVSAAEIQAMNEMEESEEVLEIRELAEQILRGSSGGYDLSKMTPRGSC